MLGSAEFRADAEIGSRFVRLKPDVIRMPRDGRYFSRQLRHPEFVQHVSRFKPKGHRLSHWNVKFIGDYDTRFWVAPLPPPLMAGHDNVRIRRGGGSARFIVRAVSAKSATTITHGIAVQTISIVLLPAS